MLEPKEYTDAALRAHIESLTAENDGLSRLLEASAEETRINFNGLLDAKVDLAEAIAERDRLAAECEELRGRLSALESVSSGYQTAMWEATATLDALREVVGPSKTISNSTCMKVVDILYPATPKESFREIAARHGFKEMPPEIGQQTVDGETMIMEMPDLAYNCLRCGAKIPPINIEIGAWLCGPCGSLESPDDNR